MSETLQCVNNENVFGIIARMVKKILFMSMTNKSMNLFMRGGDIISVSPQIFGTHDEGLTNSIKFYANCGYRDFFIDIGANIGLTSCQNGSDFEEVHMFEPNNLCCNILEVNANIALDSSKFKIYRYGLGEKDKQCILTVPKHNWGGAFIRDENNSYSDSILASKDGFKNIDRKEYFDVEIKIKNSENELKNIFSHMISKGLKKGIIKIDVEGYEETVLIGIANALPKDIMIVILFESWDKSFNISKIVDAFDRVVFVKKITRYVPWNAKSPKLIKFASLFLKPFFKTKITTIDDGNLLGDIILEIR
jgi:FkbM family methyltransferase